MSQVASKRGCDDGQANNAVDFSAATSAKKYL